MLLVRIRQPMDFRLPAQCRECDDAVVQRSAAAEHLVSGVRVGVRQLQIGVGVQLQAVLPYAPAPRL
jgi:hypothetical protein